MAEECETVIKKGSGEACDWPACGCKKAPPGAPKCETVIKAVKSECGWPECGCDNPPPSIKAAAST
ncbi:hypothetical protein FS837_012173 [Tulasnella sp. UAMH 9824]|nr:hypothetical protein FS837_012173 [Tulasnella sp. UAMH 9824]